MRIVATRILDWYATHARPLPWREHGTSAWGIYVSEVMAQQTQMSRVVTAWEAWLQRWPTPADLAASSPADAVRQWSGLGYPRRALWMHAAARAMVSEHAGAVPSDDAALRALPGVGEYTSAAVRAFAFGQRVPVLDVNVRRVHARVFDGHAMPGASITVAERAHHERFLPSDAPTAGKLSQAVMEFGALVCTAREPACDSCLVRAKCLWRIAGAPAPIVAPRIQKRYEGSDRQCRGALLRMLRDAQGSVAESALEQAWAEELQRSRCLDALVADGLVVRLPRRRVALPN